jgi:hypothetical protein
MSINLTVVLTLSIVLRSVIQMHFFRKLMFPFSGVKKGRCLKKFGLLQKASRK